ncbi:MAG: alpha/beta hydrolase [Alcaligenaceae bacterium]
MSIKHSDVSIQYGYATVALGQMHYAQAGAADAPPLILMHAAGRSSSCYRHMLPLLAKDFRAIAIDLPGFGYSARMAANPTIDSLAHTLAELIDTLALQRPHIFGLHTGNKIAAALAANYPQRVGDVILAGQTHSLILDMKVRNAALSAYCDKYFPKYAHSSDGSHLLKAWNITQTAVEGFWWPPELLNAQATRAEDLAQAEVRVIDHLHGWASIVPLYQAIFEFDLPEVVKRIQARTLVLELLTQQEAHYGPQGKLLCDLIPGAEHEQLQNAVGLSMEYRPDEIVTAIRRFLCRV